MRGKAENRMLSVANHRQRHDKIPDIIVPNCLRNSDIVKKLRLSCRSGCLIHNGTCIRVSRVRVTYTVTIRVSRVSVMNLWLVPGIALNKYQCE